jgi:hypothetical protein
MDEITPAGITTTETETLPLTPVDPRKKSADPSMKSIDRIIENLKPAILPSAISPQILDECFSKVSNSAASIHSTFNRITKISSEAATKFVEQFDESVADMLPLIAPSEAAKLKHERDEKSAETHEKIRIAEETKVAAALERQLSEIDSACNTIDALVACAPTPVALLQFNSPVDETRSRYQSILVNESYAGLLGMTTKSFYTESAQFRAAVASELSRRAELKIRVPISASAYADRIVGREHKALLEKQSQIHLLVRHVEAARKTMLHAHKSSDVQRRAGSLTKISLGLSDPKAVAAAGGN